MGLESRVVSVPGQHLSRYRQGRSISSPRRKSTVPWALHIFVHPRRSAVSRSVGVSFALLIHYLDLGSGANDTDSLGNPRVHLKGNMTEKFVERWNLRRASDKAIPNQAPGMVGEGVETGGTLTTRPIPRCCDMLTPSEVKS